MATKLMGRKLIVETAVDGKSIRRTVAIDRVGRNHVWAKGLRRRRADLRLPDEAEIEAVEAAFKEACDKSDKKKAHEQAARRKATTDNPHWCDAKYLSDWFGSKTFDDIMKALSADDCKQLREFIQFREPR